MRNDPFILLAHELFHGLDANRGMLDDRKEAGDIMRKEYQAVFRENRVRQQLTIPLRTHYESTYDQNGVKIPHGPSMLNSSKQNVKPAWYKL